MMKAAALACCLLVSSTLLAAEVLEIREGGNYIRLHEAPCEVKAVLDLILPSAHSRFKTADLSWNGQSYRACWIDLNENVYYIIDETGDQGPIHKSRFRKIMI